MSETIQKLSPNRDLQCFFFRPSAIAAMSGATSTAFNVSGTWRQQFDWVVIEWNRDNVYEHPLLRTLPDGDLSGLSLSYEERRSNCILMDSKLFPTVDWPYLRIWAEDSSGGEQIYRVRLFDHATAIEGSAVAAEATFTLSGTLTAGDVVELAWLDEHYHHTITGSDTVATVLADLELNIDVFSTTVSASHNATEGTITLTNLNAGEEGNQLGVIANVSGFQTESWTPTHQTMSGGASLLRWQVDLDFSALDDVGGGAIPTDKVRKMRWTYAAALQPGAYNRSEFEVGISSWTVTGLNRTYSVAAPNSRRFEDDGPITFSGAWTQSAGNFSGGTIHLTNALDASASLTYTSQSSHRLLLGTRRTFEAGIVSVSVDSGPPQIFDLFVADEDVLARIDLGALAPGQHSVEATLSGANLSSAGNSLYVDFFEESFNTTAVDNQPARPNETLATDWDTDHSLALAPERVAWNLDMLGFVGRANHYVGAILFYELKNPDNVYAQGTVTFQGSPIFSQTVQVIIDGTVFSRLTLSTDTNESITKAFEFLINDGSTGVRASSSGAVLTIHARQLGTEGNGITLSATPDSGAFQAVSSGSTLTGGVDGEWFTDTTALPRLNRAARDWHRAYFAALDSLGIESTLALSMELSHGDPTLTAGIAQRYADTAPVLLNTPSLQTNFSPASLNFWKQAYLELAQLQDEAGVTPYLQFGEVQWWYFPNVSGMTFYDDYTKAEFQNQHSRPLHVFTSNDDSLASFPEEAAFLPGLIGAFTDSILNFVKATYAAAKFEVLYPHDVNDFTLTRVVNFPENDWTAAKLDVLKTENFTYTGNRQLNKSQESIRYPMTKGFPRNRSSHLIGVFGASEPWNWERRLAQAEALESVVLWAFDQFSMIGYALPLKEGLRRSHFLT
ncbi:MAG: hypothetical protein O2968_04080 [Acidobacteria bacterium]|nr:hypothetical protein [Acidobacteriota bacterium]